MGSLRKWFKDSSSTDKTPGWVEVISGEPCAREEGEEDETPKCVSSDKRASMTKSERISAQRRKSAADPNQPEKSGAAKPTYVSTDKPKKKMNEEKDIKEIATIMENCIEGLKVPFKVDVAIGRSWGEAKE